MFLFIGIANTYCETVPLNNYNKLDSLLQINSTKIIALQEELSDISKVNVELNKQISDARTKIAEVKESDEKNHIEFLHTYEKIFGSLVIILTMIATYIGFKYSLNKLLTERVAKAVDQEVSVLEKEFNEFRKHNRLRTEAKILILNETGTPFPVPFTKVLSLFNKNLTQNLDVNALNEALIETSINKIKEFDLLIIENQVDGKIWKLTEPQIQETFVKLCDLIEAKTAIIYYGSATPGSGFFPAERVKPEYQHLVTFANAPAQLYINIMNMLKFKNEISA